MQRACSILHTVLTHKRPAEQFCKHFAIFKIKKYLSIYRSISQATMDQTTRRVSLRSRRKSLKLRTQSICAKCKRGFFPPESTNSDSDTDGDRVCVDCEKKSLNQPIVKKKQSVQLMDDQSSLELASRKRQSIATHSTTQKENIHGKNVIDTHKTDELIPVKKKKMLKNSSGGKPQTAVTTIPKVSSEDLSVIECKEITYFDNHLFVFINIYIFYSNLWAIKSPFWLTISQRIETSVAKDLPKMQASLFSGRLFRYVFWQRAGWNLWRLRRQAES